MASAAASAGAVMPVAVQAALWGLLAGSALVIGAALGCFVRLPPRLIAAVMAFGAGVLISALAFELVAEAVTRGGAPATAVGFAIGASVFTLANLWLARRGARHRKRSGDLQASEAAPAGGGAALALGALLDGVPESIVIGVGLIAGRSVGLVTVAAIFLSNLPEGLSSAAGMRRAGRSVGAVLGLWSAIALTSSLAAAVGYLAFRGVPPEAIAATTGVAAGAILAMLVDTMIPEAVAGVHELTGLVTAAGFLAAFLLSRLA